ncbi:hypothetical protein V5F59_15915 [Xanthobacter autotrophicus DSM 431]|uniref:hypothetical protein n=1 Tax=Xanthobacter nonsaccharivorans TaxID=3119912 RepID=UPI00372729CB
MRNRVSAGPGMVRRGVAFGSLLAVSILAGTPALADRAAADRCAAKLTPEAKAIYQASAPMLVKGADGRAVVTEQTRTLVLSGKISHLTASESAQAAAECLVLRGG